jgi:hypothetical protein
MRNTHTYIPFLLWLQERCDTANDNLINEVSSEFPKKQINRFFDEEFRKAYDRVISQSLGMRAGDEGETVVTLDTPRRHFDSWSFAKQLDWAGYISAAVRRAGIPAHDVDSTVAGIVVYLLVQPGQLFKGWNGTSPLEARWKLAVRNAVLNAVKKGKRVSFNRGTVSLSDPGVAAPGRRDRPDDITPLFKAHVRRQLGEPAAGLLQHLLDGGQVIELVNSKTLTSYRAKELVKELKALLARFAADDPAFARSIERLLTRERETLDRRFNRAAGT